MSSFLFKIRRTVINNIPALTLLVAIFLNQAPYQISDSSLLMPFFCQIVIYYWMIYRPYLLPYFIVMLLGLLKDILDDNLIGVNALTLLVFQAFVLSQRKFLFTRSFIVVWTGFTFCLGAMILLQSLFNIYHLPISVLLLKWLISILAYVPIHWLLSKLRAI